MNGEHRYEWGTWIDKDLLNCVRDAINDIKLEGGSGVWSDLWSFVGGEQSDAQLRVASGKDWDMVLHFFMNDGNQGTEQLAFTAQHPTGSPLPT
mmetsp:Transcript_28071/g.43829  ORF Transcript_28071/g.43829 Transcript_28071/m.43829 type:complete len:94 (+) Transcript_28071:110-391(+)